MGKIFCEQVCWNCKNALILESPYGEVFIPCEAFTNGNHDKCVWEAIIKPKCVQCLNWEQDIGCVYGQNPSSIRCEFVKKAQFLTEQNKAMCFVCPFRLIPMEDLKIKCKDCPVHGE